MKQKSKKLKFQKNYIPKIQNNEEIEIYPNGIFNFFISKIIEDIEDGVFQPQKVRINIEKWLQTHYRGEHNINEDHLPSVNVRKAII